MYPDLFGIPDFSYILMIVIGILFALGLLILYFVKQKAKKDEILDVLMCTCFAVVIGVVGAILTQNLYELIKDPSTYKWTWAMTFYGGLFFGAGGFIVLFRFICKRDGVVNFKNVLIIAPACITLAHAFGRIGCLLAGCCYGIETTSWIGMPCASIDDHNHVPTQLIESIYLFILSGGLTYLAFANHFKYNFCVYMVMYGIFRFIIEFFRGDERGGADIGLSPSQIWCIILIVAVVPVAILFNKIIYKKEETIHE